MPLYINPEIINSSVQQQVKQDEFNRPQFEKQDQTPAYLKLARSASAAGMGADWASTAYGLANGGHEKNPLLRPFHDDPVMTPLAGAAGDALTTLLVERALKNHPKVMSALHWGNAAYRGGLALHNFLGK